MDEYFPGIGEKGNLLLSVIITANILKWKLLYLQILEMLLSFRNYFK